MEGQLHAKPERAPLPQSGPLDCWLHRAAGTVLVFFSGSHIAFLTAPTAEHDLLNPVFPFLANRYLWGGAALIEAALAAACFLATGRPRTSMLILTFVALMGWYHWAFDYVGGGGCGCLGLFGRLLGLTPKMEKVLAVGTLIFLVATASPWIAQVLRRLRPGWRVRVGITAALVGMATASRGQAAVQIVGTVHLQHYNPNTGQPYPQYQTHSVFSALVWEGAWRLAVTNSADARRWAVFAYDGTNSYLLTPFEGALLVPFRPNLASQEPSDTNCHHALLEPSPRLIPRSGEEIGLALVWFCYGCQLPLLKPNARGVIDWPMPSAGPRQNPACFGFRWVPQPLPGGPFLASCEFVRDGALDLEDLHAEFLRPEMDYPESVSEYNFYMEHLELRKEILPGFVLARYRCTNWVTIDGLAVPTAAIHEAYMRPGQKWPRRVVRLTASAASAVSLPVQQAIPEITAPTRVIDYRYKKLRKPRLFKYAQYVLQPGEPWKSAHDPVLLAQAEQWLRRGPRYDRFAIGGRVWIVWGVLGLMAAPLVVVMWHKRKTWKERTERL